VYFSNYITQQEGLDGYFHSPQDLICGNWYRIEGHVHWFSHAGQAPTIMEVRIYDSNNNLVHDPSDFVGMNSGKTLKSFYDAGKRYYQFGDRTTWKMGNNGPASGVGSGKIYDISCVALGNSGWIGPYSGPTRDIQPPLFSSWFPAKNNTNVSTAANIMLKVTDKGSLVDLTSIQMKVNGQAVQPGLKGLPGYLSLMFTPPGGLPAGQRITVITRVADRASNIATDTLSFTTGGTPGVLSGSWPNALMTNSPRLGRTKVSVFLDAGRPAGANAAYVDLLGRTFHAQATMGASSGQARPCAGMAVIRRYPVSSYR